MIRQTQRLVLRMPEERDLDFVTALFALPELVAHRTRRRILRLKVSDGSRVIGRTGACTGSGVGRLKPKAG